MDWVERLSILAGEWWCVLTARLISQDVEYSSRRFAFLKDEQRHVTMVQACHDLL